MKIRNIRLCWLLIVAALLVCGCGEDPPDDGLNPEVAANLKKLNDTKGGNSRWLAIKKLGELGDPAAVEPLIKILNEDNSDTVKTYAAKALGKLEDKRAVEPLIKALQTKHILLKMAAIRALGLLKDKRGLKPLLEIFRTDKTGRSGDAIVALGDLGDAEAVEPLLEKMKRASKYGGIHPLVTIVEALGKIGDERALEPIAQLTKYSKPLVRRQVGFALAGWQDKRAIPGLVECLTEWKMATRAVGHLDKLGWKPVSENDRVHALAARRDFAKLESDWNVARKVLVADLSHSDQKRVDSAAQALVHLGKTESVSDLIEAMDKTEKATVARACLNCGHGGLEKAAKKWLLGHGYRIIPPIRGGIPSPKLWGGGGE